MIKRISGRFYEETKVTSLGYFRSPITATQIMQGSYHSARTQFKYCGRNSITAEMCNHIYPMLSYIETLDDEVR